MTDNRDEFEALAVAWALDALDPAEAGSFLDHLRTCDRCAQSVTEAHETAALLATALVPVPRTPALGERLLAAVDNRLDRSSHPRHARRPTRSTRSRGVPALLAAAVIILGLAGWNVALRHSRIDAQHREAQLHAAARALLAPNARLVEMHGRSDITAVLAVRPTPRVVTDSLPPNDHTRTEYVLWGINDRRPVAIGTFDISTRDVAAIVVHATDRGFAGYQTYAISHEPGRHPPAHPSRLLAENQAS